MMSDDNAIDEILKMLDKKPHVVVKSPIAFINEKLYFFVPIAKKILKKQSKKSNDGGKKGSKGKKKKDSNSNIESGVVYNFLGVLGSEQGIAIAAERSYTSDMVVQENFYSRYIVQLDFDIGVAPFTFFKDQAALLLRGVKEALFDPESLLKYDSSKKFTLVSKLQYYVKYDEEIQSYIVACWILGTYMFVIFNYYPYLCFRAEKGAGKGTNLQLISRLAWNPTDKFIASKEAPLFRLIEQAKPTLILDEYHRMLRNKLIGPAIEAILEAGAEKGARVPRCKEGDSNSIELFDVFCPKVLASREKTEIEEKSIVIVLTKTNDVRYAERRKELDYDTEIDELRYDLFKIALNNWEEIFKVYKEMRPTQHLTGREFNFWAPILSICKVIYPEKFEEMLEYAKRDVQERLGEKFEIEDRVLTALYQNLDSETLNSEYATFTIKELKEWTEHMHHNRIISALSNLKILKRSGQGKVQLDLNKLKEIFKERGFELPKKEGGNEEGSEEVKEEEHNLYDPSQEELVQAILEAVEPAKEKYEKEQEPEGYPKTQIETNILSAVLRKYPAVNSERVRFHIQELKKQGKVIL